MKICRLLLITPFMVAAGWSYAAVSDLPLPESVFPQLDGILKGAVERSPRMLNRALDLEIAENSRIQARANLLPYVGGSASYNQAWDDRADIAGRQNIAKTYYNFSITQPVYHWGERRNNARIGEIQANIAKGSYKEGYRLLAREIRSGYLGLIAQKVALVRARFYAGFAKNQREQAEERLAKKVISESEIFAIRIAADQSQIAMERSEFDFENAKLSFARLAGSAPLSDDAIPDAIPLPAAASNGTVDELLSKYLAHADLPSTEAVNLRQQLAIDTLVYANRKTALRPKFNFVAGANQDEQSFTLNVAQKYKVNSLYVGIGMNWAIFDGFSSQAGTRSALAKKRQTENDYRQLTERLGEQAQSHLKLMGFAARSLSISDRYLVSGEGTLRTRQDEFRRGVRSDADVSQAQINYYDAQLSAINARSDYLLKNSDFLGLIMEDPVLANVSEQ